MRVLAVDTSLPACSVAVLDRAAGRLLSSESQSMPVGHAEALMPMVERCLDASGFGLAEIDLFAATVGPGSFTGVRVGVSAVRGFALATGAPAVGVTTLRCLALTALEDGVATRPFAVAIDARREEIYLQDFSASGIETGEPRIVRVDEAVAALDPDVRQVYGSGAELLCSAAGKAGRGLEIIGLQAAPSAGSVAAAAEPGGLPARPLYLRAPDAKPQGAKVLARR
ncbi:tRNA (adenosine(37)-N6)-threonylcarbamoyltransferase complex dimerization subunit type 1 TsaB [Lutibaculum baratangense]|uniref:Metal-dependent protease n=1 Tax=Lutibaculum baratangense AMV1 TaxID=631454 RepID=V4R1U9_9HYPH|nr:tRNA (adenosine(37)-N6)-threonylcarbamoyltransferase complex dimerization subunit type 1 TsaB [Lutibaculum baratangense]ESR25882.1 Metal-dependent protease [Lutibaculum baratangense AMV1]